MTPAQFQTLAIALIGTSIGWQTKTARRLEISPRTIQRWLEAGVIPEWVDLKLAEMAGLNDQKPWPRDEWALGDGPAGPHGHQREYIIHLQSPRFVARVVAVDDDGAAMPEEYPADILSGTVYSSEGYLICEIEWIDQPKAGEITQLMEAAADMIDAA